MIRAELPIPRAFRNLQDVARSKGISPDDALIFALTCIAAARMVLLGNVRGFSESDDLATPQAWVAVEQAGLTPLHRLKWWLALGSKDSINLLIDANRIIKELVSDLGRQPWDVLPTLTSTAMNSRYGGETILSSEVSELMLDLLGQPVDHLWIPFDSWGILTIRALRRGWHVKAASMLAYAELTTLPLLLAIEYGHPCAPLSDHPRVPLVDTEVERDLEGRPLTKAGFILAVPPFGISVRDSKLVQWDSSAGEGVERYVRTEAWVVHELVNRGAQKAVFLVPPSILFSRGQEKRLRDYLLHRGMERNELHSVVALPGGALSTTNIATALLTVTPGQHNPDVLMVDLGLARRSLSDIDALVKANRDIVLGRTLDDERACRVSREDILATETSSFTPSRYLHKSVEVGPNARTLEELCELVRVPLLSKDNDAVERLEIGIPDLMGWSPVASSSLQKVARLTPRRQLPTLQEDDLVLSVKGTIGKVSIVGAITLDTVVASQTCLGLRLKQQTLVSAQYLLMYLRSEAGQAQLQSFQEGAVIQHVSPKTLLSSFRVPIPDADERAAIENDYLRLCQLEKSITDIQQQMNGITAARWTMAS